MSSQAIQLAWRAFDQSLRIFAVFLGEIHFNFLTTRLPVITLILSRFALLKDCIVNFKMFSSTSCLDLQNAVLRTWCIPYVPIGMISILLIQRTVALLTLPLWRAENLTCIVYDFD